MPKPLDKSTYLRWSRDLGRLRMPEPTFAETIAAHRTRCLTLSPTHEGCTLRVASEDGGSIDLQLNAAQAIHLFRSLAAVGPAAGWMDHTGRPVTAPPTRDHEDFQAVPPPGPRA